ncbi:MAG: phosphoserine transaminase, partial [Pseudomonadota bacterium]
GARGVDLVAWESFGAGWVTDGVKQLKLADQRTIIADYGVLPDLAEIDFSRDVVFTWNGTTSGVRVPNADFIPADRAGLTLCDATSAAFAQDLDFAKLDVTTFSWQKVLGGEGGHGVIILSPRAVERLESYTPPWPLPKIFRLTKGGKLIDGIFEGATINTPSMLCVEDYLDALNWAQSIGGLEALIARADANVNAIQSYADQVDWLENLAVDPETRSNTSVCLKFTHPAVVALPEAEQAAFAKAIVSALDKQGVAYDIGAYRDAPPGLRIWAGATVETADLQALMPWIGWAFEQQLATLSQQAA